MSKSKKTKREKNELDSILAQLKESYGNSSELVDPDTTDSVDESDDDTELSSILEKIFADSTDKSIAYNDNDISEDSADTPESFDEISIDTANYDDHIPEDVNSNSDDNESFDTTLIDQNYTSSTFINDSSAKSEEVQDVDDVLQLMFANKSSETSANVYAEQKNSSYEEDSDDGALSIIVDQSLELGNQTSITEVLSENETEDDLEFEDAFDDVDNSYEEYATNDSADRISDEINDGEFSVEDEEYDSLTEGSEGITEEYEGLIEETVDDEIWASDTNVINRLVLSPLEYTFDPLQDNLPKLSTVNFHASEPAQVKETESISENQDNSEQAPELNSDDISLLLKFGYNEEAISEIGEENVQKVLSETESEFNPEFYNIPYGFCGKEFTDRKQIKEITAKYKSDKLHLMIKMIFVLITFLAILASNIYFEFFADRSAFPLFVVLEFLAITLICVIMWKKLCSGVIGIIRFEANVYSTLVLIFLAYYLYDITSLILYAVKYKTLDQNDLMLFGSVIALYTLFIAVSEFLKCIKEANAFSLISGSNEFYTAEGHIDVSSAAKFGAHASNDAKAYKIRRTSLISGYFKKIANVTDDSISLIYLIGVIPIVSLILGCSSAIISNNVFVGLTTMMITTLLCTPLACVCIPSFTEFIISLNLKKRKTAFIGNISTSDYTKTTALYFTDTDAIDIISCTEIQPGKSTGAKEALSIAHEVFNSLGGPLGKATANFRADDSTDEIRKEIIINSISDNGIDLYYNSSLNILIGDKQYMQSHNLKVKTDTSLHTATKGMDRSVIYMAFDGVPKLGFIITSKVKPNFSEIVSLLTQNDIRVFVDSYEPQINDFYFEQNKIGGAQHVTICKSGEHDYVDFRSVCNGNIICVSDSTAVAKSILASKSVAEIRDHNQRTHLLLSMLGAVVSIGFGALLCFGSISSILDNIRIHIPNILNAIMLCELIPGAVSIFKLWKKDSLIPDNQGNIK